jgi:phosphonoacetaldehyde hydrolase
MLLDSSKTIFRGRDIPMDFVFRRAYRGALKAVILDWAGTTVDYGSRAPAMVFVEVFQRYGVPITLSEAREPMGMAKKDHIRTITQMPAVIERWQAVHGQPPTKANVEAMYETFVPLQLEALIHYANLIPGTREAVTEFRRRGLKIGSNTGYNYDMTQLLLAEARRQGYEPDSTVCASEVPAGRPEPWMALRNAMELRVYPLEAIVKVDDTVPGIEEGLNAGMWTIGLAKTGNEIGLSEAEVTALEPEALQARLRPAYQRFYQAGAHYVVDEIGHVPAVLDEIAVRLNRGEKP